MNHLVIRNGKVENIVVIDPTSNWEPPKGTTLVPFAGRAWIGAVWNGSEVINPDPSADEPHPDVLANPPSGGN